MKTKDNRGVICDLCTHEETEHFTYYSYDLRLVQVRSNRKPKPSEILRAPITKSIDLCVACHNHKADTAVKGYSPTKSGTRCDLTKQLLVGTYEFYYVNVTRVDVRFGQPGSGSAVVNTDDRHLELEVSTAASDAQLTARKPTP